jgi:CheY-like chemotaxis protein
MLPCCDRCGAEALLLSTVTGLPLCADCATLEERTRQDAPPVHDVLIVEDSEPFAYALRRRVERTGRRATVVSSAATALVEMRRQPPDVILCDDRLSGPMSGSELLELVKVLYPAARRVLYSARELPEGDKLRARGVAHVVHDSGPSVDCLIESVAA